MSFQWTLSLSQDLKVASEGADTTVDSRLFPASSSFDGEEAVFI